MREAGPPPDLARAGARVVAARPAEFALGCQVFQTLHDPIRSEALLSGTSDLGFMNLGLQYGLQGLSKTKSRGSM